MDESYHKFICDGIRYVLGDDGSVYINRRSNNVYQTLVGHMDYDNAPKIVWLDGQEEKHKYNKNYTNTGVIEMTGVIEIPGVIEMPSTSIGEVTPSSSKRKPCENNWAEMLLCIVLLYPDLKTKTEVLSTKEIIKHNPMFKCSGGTDNIDLYFKDIEQRSDETIKTYIENFDSSTFGSFDTVILSGKSSKEFPIIYNNPHHINIDRKMIKSDIFLIYGEGIKGLSVKDSNGATLTNFSFEKLCGDIKVLNSLKDKRLDILKGCFGEGYKYKKDQRPLANKLFYDKDNEYFKEIDSIIHKHNKEFTDILLSYVFPSLNYDVYGYNGERVVDLNKLSHKIHSINLRDIKRENKYESDSAAKLWYSLYLDNCEKWKFCIRGKNDLWKGSMQVLEFTKIQ